MAQRSEEEIRELLRSNEVNDKTERGNFINGDEDAMDKNLCSVEAMTIAFESLCRNNLLEI